MQEQIEQIERIKLVIKYEKVNKKWSGFVSVCIGGVCAHMGTLISYYADNQTLRSSWIAFTIWLLAGLFCLYKWKTTLK